MRQETFDLPAKSNDLKTRLETALANCPEWAHSFTATALYDEKVRVKYYDNAAIGVDLQSARNYVERH